MAEKNKYLAIIPARGGSKRLLRKNLAQLEGKPLISWSIEAALGCKEISQIVVSSDDDEILEVAHSYSVETIKRPENLATDTATTFDVVKHAIRKYPNYDYIVLLQPTSPLRKAKHIAEAIKKLEFKQADVIVSVCEMEYSPLWSGTLPSDDCMIGFLPNEIKNKRSQDLTVHYRLNGSIYIGKTEKILEEESFFLRKNIYAYVMPQEVSVDIDTELDFKWAQFLISQEIV